MISLTTADQPMQGWWSECSALAKKQSIELIMIIWGQINAIFVEAKVYGHVSPALDGRLQNLLQQYANIADQASIVNTFVKDLTSTEEWALSARIIDSIYACHLSLVTSSLKTTLPRLKALPHNSDSHAVSLFPYTVEREITPFAPLPGSEATPTDLENWWSQHEAIARTQAIRSVMLLWGKRNALSIQQSLSPSSETVEALNLLREQHTILVQNGEKVQTFAHRIQAFSITTDSWTTLKGLAHLIGETYKTQLSLIQELN